MTTLIEGRRLTLRKNFSWTFTGNGVLAACQWFIMVAIAKLGNSEMLGQWSFAIALATPIYFFSNLQLRPIQATDATYRYSFLEYLGARLVGVLLALSIIAIIVISTRADLVSGVVIAVYSLGRAVDGISDIYFGHLQREESMDLVAKAKIINGVSSLILFAAMLWMFDSIVLAAIGYALSSVGVLIFYLIPAMKWSQQRERLDWNGLLQTNPGRLRSLIWFALPLGIVSALMSLTTSIPQYQLEIHFDSASLGIYSALAYLALAGQTVTVALSQSAAPRLSRYFVNDNFGQFSRLLLKLLAVAVVMGTSMIVVAVSVGEELISLLYTDSYSAHADAFIILSAASAILFCVNMLSAATTAVREFRPQLAIYLVTVVTVALSSTMLVPSRGAQGASLSLLVGSVLLLLLYGLLLSYKVGARRAKGTLEPR